MSQQIVPFLWFDTQAREAAEFYVSLFHDSKILNINTISDTPSATVEIINFQLWGNEFTAMSAGSTFKMNPSISMYTYCGSDAEIERIYHVLMDGGTALMELGEYPWNRKYAWVQDKFGLSWQLDVDDFKASQKIVPAMLFVNKKFDLVKPAMDYYTSIFPGSRIIMESPYDSSAGVPEGTLLFGGFWLGDRYYLNAMSGPGHHDFDFNEAVSLVINCKDQHEVDYYWEKLTDEGHEQPCGWVKDRFGVSWQIVPTEMNTLMSSGTPQQRAATTAAMLKMKKIDLETLRKAHAFSDM